MSYPIEYINPETGEERIVNNVEQEINASRGGFVPKTSTGNQQSGTEPTGWTFSDRMVADYVYVDSNGKVFFLYNITSVTGDPTYIMYEATGLSEGDYNTRWDNDSLGNARYGPEKSYVLPEGWNIITSEGTTGTPLTMHNFQITKTAEGTNLGDWIGMTMDGLHELYPFLYEQVEGRLPAIGLIFNSIISGKPITQEQMTLAGVGKGFTKLKLAYLNAIIATVDGDPSTYNLIDKDGNLVTAVNQEYLALEQKVETGMQNALSKLGLDVDTFKKDNPELYKALLTALTMGDIEYDFATGDTSHFEKYLGYKLGIEGYKVEKDSAIYTLYAGVDAKVNAPGQFNAFVDYDTFKTSENAKDTLIQYIGIAAYNALPEEEKTRLIGLYSTNQNAALTEYQKLFDSDPRFEKYSGKNLNYSQIVGNYKSSYRNIFGEDADEEDPVFLDTLGMSIADTNKSFRTHAYKTGNEKFMRDMAVNIRNSLGGVVI